MNTILYILTAQVCTILLLWYFRKLKATTALLPLFCIADGAMICLVYGMNVLFTVLFLMAICAVTCLIAVEPESKLGYTTPLLLFFLAILSYIVVFCRDLVTLVCAWLCISVLAGVLLLRYGNVTALEASTKYLVFSALGTAFIISGIALCSSRLPLI